MIDITLQRKYKVGQTLKYNPGKIKVAPVGSSLTILEISEDKFSEVPYYCLVHGMGGIKNGWFEEKELK